MEHTVEIHKQIFFEEMGSLLKTKREENNLSIEDVVNEMKFSKDIVYAMEHALVERLPNPVYAKGFYRAYASLLHIDQSITDAFINTAFVDKEQEPAPQLLNIQMNGDKEENTFDAIVDKTHIIAQYKRIAIAVVMVFIVLFIVGYFIFSSDDEASESVIIPNEPQSEIQPIDVLTPSLQGTTLFPKSTSMMDTVILPTGESTQSVLSEQAKGTATNTTQPSTNVKEQSTVAVTKKQERPKQKEESTSQKEEVITQLNSEQNTNVLSKPSVEERKGVLRIVATGEVWIEAQYDGKTTDFTLQEGQSHTITFTGKASVKIGDLSSAELYFGDKVMKNLGDKGKVKTFTFSTNE